MSGSKAVQGIRKPQELDPRLFEKDVRSSTRKFRDWMAQPNNLITCMFMMLGATWYYPGASDLIVPVWKRPSPTLSAPSNNASDFIVPV